MLFEDLAFTRVKAVREGKVLIDIEGNRGGVVSLEEKEEEEEEEGETAEEGGGGGRREEGCKPGGVRQGQPKSGRCCRRDHAL